MTLRPLTYGLSLVLCAIFMQGCGSERATSGVWRDPGCTDGDDATPCRDENYELHIGRYGQTVTGVIVRYRAEEGLNPYQRTNACDCHFIESGRALDDEIEFRLFKEDPTCDSSQENVCDACECPGRRFKLVVQEDDTLKGVTRCIDGRETEIRFVRVSGPVRTRCSDIDEAR